MASTANTGNFTFIDVFAGCGGLSLGLMQAGWQGLFAIEKDINAFETFAYNLATENARYRFSWPSWLPKISHSINDILKNHQANLAELEGAVDMIVGGPPCQGFSSAGRRDPNDPRNRLVESYLKFVGLIKPKIVLVENVKGITQDFVDTNATDGKINYSKQIIDSLSIDYFVSSKMIDTSAFGVPQTRHRFFVIAIKKELIPLFDENLFDALEKYQFSFLRLKGIHSIPVSSKSAISDLEIARNGKQPSRDSAGFEEIAYIGPQTSYQRLMHCEFGSSIPDTRLARHKPEIANRFKKIIELCHADGRLNVTLSAELKASFGLRKCAIRVLDPDSPSPTITSMPDDLIHYSEPRALTVRENARLQSFPDWFAFKGKYTTGGDRRRKEVPRFTQVANAVPPLMAEVIGRVLATQLLRLNQNLDSNLTSPAVDQSDLELLEVLA